jgi:hypothetical protein
MVSQWILLRELNVRSDDWQREAFLVIWRAWRKTPLAATILSRAKFQTEPEARAGRATVDFSLLGNNRLRRTYVERVFEWC